MHNSYFSSQSGVVFMHLSSLIVLEAVGFILLRSL